MPSGKKAKQLRREAAATASRTPPPVRSKGAGGMRARQASPRVLAIAGGVAAVVVVAIVLGVVLSRGNSSASTNVLKGLPAIGNANASTALPGAPEANALFKGIPQKGLVLGNPGAPVEMEMFIDVQCPVCQNYEINYLPTIVQKYIRPGKVQLHLQPWAFIGPQSDTGRLGLIAATFQNKGFEYAKVLYDNQGQENTGWLTDRMMAQIAASVTGLKLQQWLNAKNGSNATQIASKVDKLAATADVTGTPTVWVGPNGGKLHDIVPAGTAPNLQQTEKALDQALGKS
jgi:protein-disulfide isomerase